MFVLVCYDVADARRLRRVAREMENFGTRVQRSVFECYLDDEQLEALQGRIARLLDIHTDKVRYYGLCGRDVAGIVIDGVGSLTRDWEYKVV